MIKMMSGPVTFGLTPKECIRSVNANPNASFVLSTWMLKSPTISALSTVTNRSEKKSANSFRKSVHQDFLFCQIKPISDFWLCDVTWTLAPPTNVNNQSAIFSMPERLKTRIAPNRFRCFVVGSNEHSSRHLLLTSELLKMWRITFVFEGNARRPCTT